MNFFARHFAVGLCFAAVGGCCIVFKEALVAAQRDAIRPTDPQAFLVLNAAGVAMFFSGVIWLGVAGLNWLASRKSI